MSRKNQFWWFISLFTIIISTVIIGSILLAWYLIPQDQIELIFELVKDHFELIFSIIFLLIVILWFALDGVYRFYIQPAARLAEETAIILSVNPSHRISLNGSRDMVMLSKNINEAATQIESLKKNIQERVRRARVETEEERNILAAIMSGLEEGILICNTDGNVLLYNQRVEEFLSMMDDPALVDEALETEPGRFIGLGRSIYSILDKNVVQHALADIKDQLEKKQSDAVSCFVVAGKKNRLLRVEVVPILNHREQFSTGFILVFSDITLQIESEGHIESILESFTRKTRAAVASIRSAVEAILEYREMNEKQLGKLHEIIYQESLSIGKIVEDAASDYYSHFHTKWPVTRIHAKTILEIVKKQSRDKLGIDLSIEYGKPDIWIQLDNYSFIMSMLVILKQLKQETGNTRYRWLIDMQDDFINLDLVWDGSPIMLETLKEWDHLIINEESEGLFTLKEIRKYHEAKIWSFSREQTDESYLRLLLPSAKEFEPETRRNPTILPTGRPEFFDFDLFNQPGQSPEMDHRHLNEISYTVFDTETTGLNPKGGDEIISLGAVRIVNGRLLQEELFDRLINPHRTIPWESIQIHGIQPEMLKDQPAIGKILPLFKKFSEDTVLVAHNAAFDMRMLQIKEESTGIKFSNPVLDTMLLSAVIHPGQKDHSMEGIAERLGVIIKNRHTALGDAMATGEIFLKMIPLLEKMGLHTLRQARNATQKTYYARIKY